MSDNDRYKSPEQVAQMLGLPYNPEKRLDWVSTVFIWLLVAAVVFVLMLAMGERHDKATGADTRPCPCRKHHK